MEQQFLENLAVWLATFCVFTQEIHMSLWWVAAMLQRLGGIFKQGPEIQTLQNTFLFLHQQKTKVTGNKETITGLCKPP